MNQKTITNILNSVNLDTWIISDTHLGHKNVLDFEPNRLTRMLIDGYFADEHDTWVVDTWNSIIKPNDTVLHLGDFAFKGVNDFIKRLNGNIIFVLGNHDDKPKAQKWKGSNVLDGFYFYYNNEICKIMDIDDQLFSGFIKELGNIKILFSHYPVFHNCEYDRKNKLINKRIKLLENIYISHKCELNIHGHTHSINSTFDNSRNASLENIDMRPQKIREIILNNHQHKFNWNI